jgi:putative tricarboxylic transport membrane protein
MFEVWVMVAAGFIGYVFKFPAVLVVLDIILAPLADENLRRALMLFKNNRLGFFAKQYIGHVLVIAIALFFIEGSRRRHCARETVTAVAGNAP